jgi:cytochrome c-type biogenesis protein CcmH
MRRLLAPVPIAVLCALVAWLALGVPAVAWAQSCPRTTLADIEDEVMCPICGTPLALATEAPQAQRQRAYVERQIADCRSKDEIKQALVAQFGESVLALPGDGDDDDVGDVLVYLVPALGLMLALGGIAIAVLRWRRRPRTRAAAGPLAESGRLDSDMQRYDL